MLSGFDSSVASLGPGFNKQRGRRMGQLSSHELHVLRLTPHFYWPQFRGRGWPIRLNSMGGLPTQVFRQTLGLNKLGINQTVVTLHLPSAPRDWSIDTNIRVRGVRVTELPFSRRDHLLPGLSTSWMLGTLAHIVRSPRRWDLIHLHSDGSIPSFLLGMAARAMLGVPLIVTTHSTSLTDPSVSRRVQRLEASLLTSHAEVIVALTRKMSRGIHDWFKGTKPRIDIVPDALDAGAFQSAASPDRVEEMRNRFNLPRDRPIVGYVGRISSEKGWDFLVEAADELRHKKLHFLVCGDGIERRLLETSLIERQLTECFTITGFVGLEDVPPILGLCRCLVLPSRREEFGGVLLEAMSLGVPQIAFAIGGIPETMGYGSTGMMVEAGNVSALSAAIVEMIEDYDLFESCARSGRERVLEYSLAKACARVLAIYESVLRTN